MIHKAHKSAESFPLAHIHQKRSNQEAEALTVSDFFVVEREAFQNSSEHLLAFSTSIAEEINTWERPADVFVDDAFVWAFLVQKSIERILK